MHESPAVATDLEPPESVLCSGASVWRWRRSLSTALASYSRELLGGPWFAVRATVGVGEMTSAIEARLADRGLAERPERELFVSDIAELGALLATAAGCATVEVRVEHDPGGMCPVFHQDNKVMRLLCTYAGPGTEWLPEEHLDRSQLGLQGRTSAEANRAIALGEPSRSRPGEVLIVKGAQFGVGHAALVHRSPSPALGSRLFVAVDPVEEMGGPRCGSRSRRRR